MSLAIFTIVMPALVAGIHDFSYGIQVVDGRDKPGHDGWSSDMSIAVPQDSTP